MGAGATASDAAASDAAASNADADVTASDAAALSDAATSDAAASDAASRGTSRAGVPHGPHRRSELPRVRISDELFALLDVDGDGEVSMGELSGHLQRLGYSPATIESIFKLLDVNSDGSISRDELRRCFLQYRYPALRLALHALPSR